MTRVEEAIRDLALDLAMMRVECFGAESMGDKQRTDHYESKLRALVAGGEEPVTGVERERRRTKEGSNVGLRHSGGRNCTLDGKGHTECVYEERRCGGEQVTREEAIREKEFEEALEMFQEWATAYGQRAEGSKEELDAQNEMHRAKVQLRYAFAKANLRALVQPEAVPRGCVPPTNQPAPPTPDAGEALPGCILCQGNYDTLLADRDRLRAELATQLAMLGLARERAQFAEATIERVRALPRHHLYGSSGGFDAVVAADLDEALR